MIPTRLILVLAVMATPPAANSAPDKADKPDKPSERLRNLQKERVKALETQLEGQFERVKIGKDPLVQLLDCLHELTDAELDLDDSRDAQIKILERSVERLKEVEDGIKELLAAGLQTKQNVAMAQAARLKAEIRLEKRKGAK